MAGPGVLLALGLLLSELITSSSCALLLCSAAARLLLPPLYSALIVTLTGRAMPAITAKDSLTALPVASSCSALSGAATAMRKDSLTSGSLIGLKLGVGVPLALAPTLLLLLKLLEKLVEPLSLRRSV